MKKSFVLFLACSFVAFSALVASTVPASGGAKEPTISLDLNQEKLAITLEEIKTVYGIDVRLQQRQWGGIPITVKVRSVTINMAIRAMLEGFDYSLRREGGRRLILSIYGPTRAYVGEPNPEIETSGVQWQREPAQGVNLDHGWIVFEGPDGMREVIRDPGPEPRADAQNTGSEADIGNPRYEWIELEGADGVKEYIRNPIAPGVQ